MTLSPAWRKLALVAHVTTSVGWLGSVVAFLALAVVGAAGTSPHAILSAYVSMHAVAWYVIVPLCLASFLSGLVQSLGTHWGLFRHYWVLIKLLMTVLATAILLLHMMPIGVAADAATRGLAPAPGLRTQLVADAIAALVVLLVAVTLSIYKPKGLTRYGHRVTQP